MALSQTDLDALDTAIASAEPEVEIEGRRVKIPQHERAAARASMSAM